MRAWLIALLVILLAITQADAEGEYTPVGQKLTAPMGWMQFCESHPEECNVRNRQVVMGLTQKIWQGLRLINSAVNMTPYKTDIEHWGVKEHWSYIDDDYADCEDYVLEKRRRLIAGGWQRAALLITIVREKNAKPEDEGHAVLTIVTDKGDFILDSQDSAEGAGDKDLILPWNIAEMKYDFKMRQSPIDPNEWFAVGSQVLRYAASIEAHPSLPQ